jgi:hypothetical protein
MDPTGMLLISWQVQTISIYLKAGYVNDLKMQNQSMILQIIN